MGAKGLAVLSKLPRVFYANVDKVVIGRDLTVIDDCSVEIEKFCNQESIDYEFRAPLVEIDREAFVFAVSWRWMIVHDAERLIVFHDSLLPKYRGFCPLINSLVAGEEYIGVTCLFGADSYDTGAIIAQKRIQIQYPITIYEAIKKIEPLYVDLVAKVLELLIAGAYIPGTPQDESLASYSLWRDDSDFVVDWNQCSRQIERIVDALGYPYKGACTFLNDDVVVLDQVEHLTEDKNIYPRHVGKVLNLSKEGEPTVVCGRGLLKIKKAHVISANGDQTPLIPMNRLKSRFLTHRSNG